MSILRTLTEAQFNGQLRPKLAGIYARYKDVTGTGIEIGIPTRMEYLNMIYSEYRQMLHSINKVSYTADDVDCEQMKQAMDTDRTMLVSTLHNHPHPLLYGFDIEMAKVYNLMARAVHDFVHYTNNFLPCTAYQEYLCWIEQSMGKEKEIKQILFSEIVLQASYCEQFGHFAPNMNTYFEQARQFIHHQKLVLVDYEALINSVQ